MLTGFVSASKEARDKFAQSSTSVLGHSPFQHNVKFTVTDFDFKVAQEDGVTKKDARLCPVLVTSIGDLFVSTITRSRVDADGNVLTPDGTFNTFVSETIAENSAKTVGETLTAIVEGCKGKTLIVERVPYIALNKNGGRYAAALVKINFVTE